MKPLTHCIYCLGPLSQKRGTMEAHHDQCYCQSNFRQWYWFDKHKNQFSDQIDSIWFRFVLNDTKAQMYLLYRPNESITHKTTLTLDYEAIYRGEKRMDQKEIELPPFQLPETLAELQTKLNLYLTFL